MYVFVCVCWEVHVYVEVRKQLARVGSLCTTWAQGTALRFQT